MPKNGRHQSNLLTAMAVRKIKAPGWHPDGNTLYLEVDASGAKRWAQRLVVHGRRRDIGLGSIDWVSLAEAREKAARNRKIAREGGDPLSERRRQSEIPTFEAAAKTVHGNLAPTFRNPKHAAQWITTLETYAFPYFGKVRVNIIDTPDVLRALQPIWTAKPETARRVRQRITTVLDWAKAAGHRTGDNPVSGVKQGLKKHERVGQSHHAALSYQQLGEFLELVRREEGVAARALEFTVLTAARTGEVIYADAGEFDLDAAVWTVPAERMKAKREHRVPLSERAVEILKARPGGGLVFPLSNMAMLELLRRMERDDITVHGFRSTFRDWAAERTNHPRDVCEKALAHTIGNKTEAAYQRGDLFEKRRVLMADWADYCAKPEKAAKVTPIRKKA